MKSDRCLSSELEGFHPRQRELLRVILTSGGATVREIYAPNSGKRRLRSAASGLF